MENQNFTLTTTQILNDLKNGLTRESIKEKYGMTNRELKEIFQHPDLKGRKTRPANRFTLISDTPSEETDPQDPMDIPSQEILDSQDYLQTDPQDSLQEEGVLETTEFDPEPQTIEDTVDDTVEDNIEDAVYESWDEEPGIEKSTFTI